MTTIRCYRCGEIVDAVSFYSRHLPDECEGKRLVNILQDMINEMKSCPNCCNSESIKIIEQRISYMK